MSEPTHSTITSFFVYRSKMRATEARPGFLSKQSFNFSGHYSPERTGFGSIRVFNDDLVEDQVGIPMHPHENFEILSVILSGEMAHQDNLGNNLLIKTNEVKLMSAGSGLFHGGVCYNTTNFLQIWIAPNQLDTPPAISTLFFDPTERRNRWQLQVSPEASENVLTIRQSLRAYRGVFGKNQLHTFQASGRYSAFMMPLSGSILLQEQKLESRDSAEFHFQDAFSFCTYEETDVWLMIQEL
jgi:quercetin 2,3-dioxygenase